jgi:hypothetical protein
MDSIVKKADFRVKEVKRLERKGNPLFSMFKMYQYEVEPNF